ncbi:MAG TPA: polyprenyl synthetase family protein, partial [Mycobacterium sp.]|nr:polyprenyl synthetase family protein [Mycobacterium sp.]
TTLTHRAVTVLNTAPIDPVARTGLAELASLAANRSA